MAKKKNYKPKNYFLNERHQLSPVPKKGGGRDPKFDNIDWASKAQDIGVSIDQISKEINKSNDPTKDDRYFAVAIPEVSVRKLSDDKKKAPEGTFLEDTEYDGSHSKVFERLGLDLIDVSESGEAIVHAKPEVFQQLRSRISFLTDVGVREQARWATLNSFKTIPADSRINRKWLQRLPKGELSDVVFELQPFVNKVEAHDIFQSIAELLSDDRRQQLTGSGVDFSGRYWVRGKAVRKAIRKIAKSYFSIQSIHDPLYSYFFNNRSSSNADASVATQNHKRPTNTRLPCVAVLDTGTPSDHIALAEFSRGQYVVPGALKRDIAEHGSRVASRVVFGDCSTPNELDEKDAECSYFDVVAADAMQNRVDDKLVVQGLAGVRANAPDIRVFNLSFGSREPLSAMDDVVYRERLIELQDLDNFVFANDAVVVVASGNANLGVIPTTPYPNHAADPRWGLGAWACGYNTLVCGSHVSKVSPDGLADYGYPSPFTRIGYGLNGAPIPSFSESGGNCDSSYQYFNGAGVYNYGRSGLVEDSCGTSLAAPILARKAALTVDALRKYCPDGSEPSAVLVRACLATFAERIVDTKLFEELADRTLGLGQPQYERVKNAKLDSAIVMWQGVLESQRDLVRIKIPIPKDWLKKAEVAELKLCVCYDPPVNYAAVKNWACRKVDITIRTDADNKAVRGGTNRGHSTYPLYFKKINLTKTYDKSVPKNDFWIVEVRYSEISPYAPGNTFDPRQRVAIVAELKDASANPANPHESLQKLSFASELNQLSANASRSQTPVIIRSR